MSTPGIKNLIEAGKEINKNHPEILDLSIYYGKEELDDKKSKTNDRRY